MKKLVCILMTAMMLVFCGCESAERSSSAESSAKTSASAYTKKLSIDNVSFCVPEDCREEDGKDSIKYYYYPDGGFIMTSYYDNGYKVSIHNDDLVEGLTSGINSKSDVQNFSYEKTFINNIPVLLMKMEMHYDTSIYYCFTVYLMSNQHMVSLGISSGISFDDAEAKYKALADTIELTDKADNEASKAKEISNSWVAPDTAEPKGGKGIFEKRVYESGFSFCIPQEAVETTGSGDSKSYEGTEAVILIGETSYLPDLTDDQVLYSIYKTYDFERKTINGTTVVKIITSSEGKHFGWVLFSYLGTFYNIGITSKIDAVSYSNVRTLLDDFAETLDID